LVQKGLKRGGPHQNRGYIGSPCVIQAIGYEMIQGREKEKGVGVYKGW